LNVQNYGRKISNYNFVSAIDTKDFVTIGDHRYYFSVLPVSFIGHAIAIRPKRKELRYLCFVQVSTISIAIGSCNDANMSLVSIETEEERLNITAYINDVLSKYSASTIQKDI
jgi:hypothetical protein